MTKKNQFGNPSFKLVKYFNKEEEALQWLSKFYGRTWPKNPRYFAKYADDHPWVAHVWF